MTNKTTALLMDRVAVVAGERAPPAPTDVQHVDVAAVTVLAVLTTGLNP